MTASGRTLQNMAIFLLTSWSMGCSARQRMTSGAIPISRSFATLCWVGFVFSSSAALMKGTSVAWMKATFSWPTSSLNWRRASRKGSPSMSPVVPPISVMMMSMSSRSATSWMRFLITSVTCGMTWTVAPR